MSLKIKLMLAFLGSMIIPFAVMGTILYHLARVSLQQELSDNLLSVAAVQEHRLDQIAHEYLNTLAIVTSQTSGLWKDKDLTPESRQNILFSFQNAQRSIDFIHSITLRDAKGAVIVSTNNGIEESITSSGSAMDTPSITGFARDVNNNTYLQMHAPLLSENRTVGFVEILADINPIVSITNDYTSLHQTGETTVAMRNRNGDALYITPLRYDASAPLMRSVRKEDQTSPIIRALQKEENVFLTGMRDYRGAPVIAATNYVESLGWGISVKIDQVEAFAPLASLRRFIFLFASLSALVLGSVALLFSQLLTRSLISLKNAAAGMAHGQLGARATVHSSDEIGALALAFNTMAEKLQNLYQKMDKNVQEKTEDIRKFQLAVDRSTDAILIINAVGNILYVNPAWEAQTGYASVEVLGKNAQIIQSDKTDPAVMKCVTEAFTMSRPYHSSDIIIRRKDGTEYDVDLSLYPVKEDSRPLFWVAIQRDVSDWKVADRAKSDFVSLASHQLRTPLTRIRWALSSLRRSTPTQDSTMLQVAHQSAISMSGTIKAMLMIARVESNDVLPEKTMVPLSALLQTIIDEREEAKENMEREIHLDCRDDVVLCTDPQLLREVVANLISNACKYSAKNGKIHLHVREQDGCIVMKIADNGMGIPHADQAHIAQKFFRASNALKSTEEGSGIGLYIVYALVRILGGTVSFTSTENVGTVFTLVFPLHSHGKNVE